MTPSRLQSFPQRIERTGAGPPPTYPTTYMLPAPSSAHFPTKDRLLKWRLLLTTTMPPLREDLKRHHQLTALAWEPLLLTLYASRLLVFHAWGNSKGMPDSEAECAPVPEDMMAHHLAGTYIGGTIANSIQGICDFPWHINELQYMHQCHSQVPPPRCAFLILAPLRAAPHRLIPGIRVGEQLQQWALLLANFLCSDLARKCHALLPHCVHAAVPFRAFKACRYIVLEYKHVPDLKVKYQSARSPSCRARDCR